MTNDFYTTFEEKHRGSRELIASRLAVYLPFIQPLQAIYPDGKALDVGCGRGEWLEILTDLGFDSEGVDLDDGMLQACRERNLRVTVGDAISHMSSLPENCQCIVSGFHVAEHLPFDQLQELVREAHRILVPGGLLILETPNPENLSVGTNSFYLDPTHQRPIPPGLLSFLPEYYGFTKIKIIRLQEDKTLANKVALTLADVITGVSPDYAVVAQKAGPESILEPINRAFNREYGLSLSQLLNSWDRRFDLLQGSIERAEASSKRAEELQVQLLGVLSSRSWRITRPLRWISTQKKKLNDQGLKSRTKALLRKLLLKIDIKFRRFPRLRQSMVVLSQRLRMYSMLKSTLGNLNGSLAKKNFDETNIFNVRCGLNNLPPRAQKIYSDLQDAINNLTKKDL